MRDKRILPLFITILFTGFSCFGGVFGQYALAQTPDGEGTSVTENGEISLHEETPQPYRVYLGSEVEKMIQNDYAWQSADIVGKGYSCNYYALEKQGEKANTFLRLANFNGAAYTNQTAVDLACQNVPVETTVTIRFSYRLYEGLDCYRAEQTVFTLFFRGADKAVGLNELVYNAEGDSSWHTYSCTLTPTMAINAEYAVLNFMFSSEESYSVSRCCLDVDNFAIYTAEQSSQGVTLQTFEGCDVTENDTLDTEYDTAITELQTKALSENALLYAENTTYTQSVSLNFNDGFAAAALGRQGSEGIYGGTGNESDVFAVYDSYTDNTFLRLSNVNGTNGTTQTRVVCYFYNTSSGLKSNMPLTESIYFSFRYRLYLNDYIRAGMADTDTVVELSTRSSSKNNSGKLTLQDLVVNEEGDDTWHTYAGKLDVSLSNTSYFYLFFYSPAATTFAQSTFIDIDDVSLSDTKGGQNYVYTGGTFEGLAGTDSAQTESIYTRTELGTAATKVALNSFDYAMQMGNGQTFSVRTDIEVPQRVCYMQLDITAQAGDSLALYLTGRSGTRFDLTVGKNCATDTYQVEWTGENDSWHCKWYGVKATSSRVTSIDFVNTGNHTITLDNLFFAGVNGICNEAGDYAAFSKALTDYETNFVTTEYREQDVKTVLQAVIQAKKLTAYSSQERLDSALQALSSAIASAQKKADLTVLNGILSEATAFMQDRESSVQKSSWLIFQNAYLVATQITDENSQQEVDEASENLQLALTDVQTQAQNNSQDQSSNSSVVTLSVVGGSAVGLSSLVAVGAFLLKRRVL